MGWKRVQIEIKGVIAISIIALLLIIIGTGWFYWYEWRPSQIRKECSLKSYYPLDMSKILQSDSEKDQSYKECLRVNGLEK